MLFYDLTLCELHQLSEHSDKMNTQYKSVNYRMIKKHIKNSLNKQFPLKINQRYGRQFKCNSKCSEKLLCLLSVHCSCFDAYLVGDFSMLKGAVKFSLSFCGFDFQKRTSCSEEKCKIRIGEKQLRFTVWYKISYRIHKLRDCLSDINPLK